MKRKRTQKFDYKPVNRMTMKQVCMVPSNTLSASDASKLALKLLESPIVADYLSETNGLPPSLVAAIVPGVQDWWDTVNKSSYASVISKRHGKSTYETLMADKYFVLARYIHVQRSSIPLFF